MNDSKQLTLQSLMRRLEALEQTVREQGDEIERLRMQQVKPLLGPKEVAERLGVSRRTVTNMVGDGVLPMFKVGGQLRIHPDTLERVIRYLAER